MEDCQQGHTSASAGTTCSSSAPAIAAADGLPASKGGSVESQGVDPDAAVHAVAEERKAAGNERFREGDLEAALARYGEALEALGSAARQEPALRATLASNQALCLLRLGRFAAAEARASVALAADSANGKAAYRRGQARLQLGDTRGAYEDLQKAVRLEPQNREVRQRCEEARSLAEAEPADSREVAVASGAAGALGGQGGGLYSEKEDLNEGRLAETYREQKEWISTITDWTEIRDVSFVDEEDKSCVSVYMALPGVHGIPTSRICVWLRPNSLEIRVIDLQGTNWFYLAQELWGQIDAEASTWKARKDKLSLKLQKRASARSWDRWEKLRRI